MKIFRFFSFLFLLFSLPLISQTKSYQFNTQDYYPYSYSENGSVSGPYAEILSVAAKKAGIAVKYRLLNWKDAQDQVAEGKADGLFLVAKNIAREKWLYFSIPISVSEYCFYVRKDNLQDFTKPLDIAGMRIGVYGPSNSSFALETLAKNIKRVSIEMMFDDIPCFYKLNDGKLDTVFSNRDVGNAIIKKHRLNIRYAFSYSTIIYYIGFSKKSFDQTTFEKINTALAEMKKSGEIGKILSKYGLIEAK